MAYRAAVGAALIIATCSAKATQAQTFIDGFTGFSTTGDRRAAVRAEEARIDDAVVPAALRIDIDRLRLDGGRTVGMRAGHWFGALGVAVDVASIDLDVRRQRARVTANLRFDEKVFGDRVTIDPGVDVAVPLPRVTVPTTLSIAPMAMLRVPRGTVQPYAFAGPTYVVTSEDLSGSWGGRVGGGARIALTESIGIFAEYRYTFVNASAVAGRFRDNVGGLEADSGAIRVDVKYRSRTVVAGVGLRF